MGKQHNRRIFAGFYKRYDGKFIYVVAVVPDVDTGEQVVIFHEGIDACECKYYSMTKQSFCEMVEVDGEWVDKFIRQPQVRITDTHIQNLIDGGFNGPVRKSKPKDEEMLAYESRSYRRAETYTDYAKDLCTNYKIDLRRYNLCVTQKRYIGVDGKSDFDILKEDLKFLNDCLKTVLKSYGTYFKERYVDGLSVRKYAEAHNMNRGSVDHLNRKFITELAAALKARDEADGVCRLHKRK